MTPNLKHFCRPHRRIKLINFRNIDWGWRISLQNLGFLKFWGQKSPYMEWFTWNLARHRGLLFSSAVPNLVTIGVTCRSCEAKNCKIAPWVIVIPTFLLVVRPGWQSVTSWHLCPLKASLNNVANTYNHTYLFLFHFLPVFSCLAVLYSAWPVVRLLKLQPCGRIEMCILLLLLLLSHCEWLNTM